jgi:hypothetical protein
MRTDIHRSLVEIFHRWFLSSNLSRWICVWLAVGVVLVVPLFSSPTHSLNPLYTDHRRHTYAAWALLNIGTDIYTTPIAQWDFGALRPFISWAPIPSLYPIGSQVLFLPFGVVNNTGLLPEGVVNMLIVMLLGIGGVGAIWFLYRALSGSYPPVLIGIVLVLAGPLSVFWGLNGFFDTISTALALYGVLAYRQENYGTALLALVGALSLHYRLWYLGPLALLTAFRYAQAQEWVLDWRLGVAGVLGGASLVSFILTIPGLMTLSSSSMLNENPMTVMTGVTPAILGALGGGLILLAIVYKYEPNPETLITLTLAVAMVFVLTQWSPWYSVVLIPALALVERRPSQVTLVVSFYWAAVVLGILSANRLSVF